MSGVDVIQLGILVATVAAAVIAAVATGVNLLIYRSQTDPEVVIFPAPDESSGQVIWLVIQNVGRGHATDVRLRWSTPPFRAFGISEPGQPEAITDGPLIEGMTSLGPGSRRVIAWGQFGGLLAQLQALGGSITATIEYKGGHRLLLGSQRRHRGEFVLDVSSFKGTLSMRSDGYRIADTLAKIEKAITAKAKAV